MTPGLGAEGVWERVYGSGCVGVGAAPWKKEIIQRGAAENELPRGAEWVCRVLLRCCCSCGGKGVSASVRGFQFSQVCAFSAGSAYLLPQHSVHSNRGPPLWSCARIGANIGKYLQE